MGGDDWGEKNEVVVIALAHKLPPHSPRGDGPAGMFPPPHLCHTHTDDHTNRAPPKQSPPRRFYSSPRPLYLPPKATFSARLTHSSTSSWVTCLSAKKLQVSGS
jgi:hypothetical protein